MRCFITVIFLMVLTSCNSGGGGEPFEPVGSGSSSSSSSSSSGGSSGSLITCANPNSGMGLSQSFTTANGIIYDSAGREFIARGINLQYGDNPSSAAPAIQRIADVCANIVRLQLRRNTTATQLQTALDQIVSNNMVAMPFLWENNITCSNDAAVLETDVQNLWLGEWLPVLSQAQYTPYLLINIANEWGPFGTNVADWNAWATTYTGIIADFRTAGFTEPLVIDAPHCGQQYNAFIDSGRGQQLIDADPLGNIILSTHAYNALWNSQTEMDANIDALIALGLPFLYGEFGSSSFEAPANDIDHLRLMERAQLDSFGWIAWSWFGNGGDAVILNMATSHDTNELTAHGQDIVNTNNGLANTSELASFP